MKKQLSRALTLAACLCSSAALVLGACTTGPDPTPGPEEHKHTYSAEWEYNEMYHWHEPTCDDTEEPSGKAEHTFTNGDKCDTCDYTREPVEQPFTVAYRAGYTPSKFGGVTNEVTKLADGVHLVKNTMTLSKDSKISVVYTIEVDLSKAGIAAGTKGNATTDFNFEKTTPYAMAQAWEQATGGQVYASINADFFGEFCVNAFVKDGVIVKDGHNIGESFDYTEQHQKIGEDANKNPIYKPNSDVPASAPMLFGVKGDTAQIAPIKTVAGDPTDPAVKEQWVTAKLSYSLVHDGKTYEVRENAGLDKGYITYQTKKTAVNVRRGVAVKVDNTQGNILKVLEVTKGGASLYCGGGEGYGWLISNAATNESYPYLNSLKVGDEISFTVTSPDGAWNGFDTILGCRQALVLNDAVASTVTLENTNGAQDRDIPRTAVGLKPDGTVVLFAVESLWYGKSKTEDVRVDSDTHGLNLPELAEFAYYYGCNVAANFDGGGSTQLTVRGEGEESPRVLIRSSDTGIADVTKTRPVMNGFLITSKKA